MKRMNLFIVLCAGLLGALTWTPVVWSMDSESDDEDVLNLPSILQITSTPEQIYKNKLRSASLEEFKALVTPENTQTYKMTFEEFKALVTPENTQTYKMTFKDIFIHLIDTPIYLSNKDTVDKIDYLINRANTENITVDFKNKPLIINQILKTMHPNDPAQRAVIPALSRWIDWFGTHQAPLDNLDQHGYTPLAWAIRRKSSVLVTKLRELGADPSKKYQEGSQQLTPLELALDQQKQSPDNEIGQIVAELTTASAQATSPSALSHVPSSSASSSSSSSSATPLTTPTITSASPLTTTTTSPTSTTTPQTTTHLKFFSRVQALWTTLIAGATIAAMYKWFTGSYKKTSKDVLINNTGKSIFVSHNDGKFQEVMPGTSFIIPASNALQETLDIKLAEKQPHSDLTYDLGQWSQTRTNHYLNLVISKNWFSSLYGPMSGSPRWVEKPATR